MNLAYHVLTAFSVLVFLYYGLSCLFANGMADDFERFGMARLRILTGVLEVLGAIGLVVGQWIPGVLIVSAGGLAVLMLFGLLTRIRHRDSLREMLPAAVLMAVNVFIAVQAVTPRTMHAQGITRSATTSRAMTSLLDSLERAGFSGSVLVADRKEILTFRTMGLADQSTGRKIVPEDRWRWASVSKQITAALVMREVDAGRIVLDTPVSSYLPGFTDSVRATITVRQLLQHTSGLPPEDGGPKDADGVARVYRERGSDIGDVAYARLCNSELGFAPGSNFNYNNCDYLVLGALLRARTGKSTEELLSALLGSAPAPGAAETVRGYLTDSAAEPHFELPTYGSAGALTGTLESLLAFDRLLLDSLLSPASLAEMWRGEPKFGFAALGAWAFEATLNGCPEPVRLIERRGAIEGIQARNLLLPNRNLVIIMFTNRADEEFGEVWQGRGLMYDVLSAAACQSQANLGS